MIVPCSLHPIPQSLFCFSSSRVVLYCPFDIFVSSFSLLFFLRPHPHFPFLSTNSHPPFFLLILTFLFITCILRDFTLSPYNYSHHTCCSDPPRSTPRHDNHHYLLFILPSFITSRHPTLRYLTFPLPLASPRFTVLYLL